MVCSAKKKAVECNETTFAKWLLLRDWKIRLELWFLAHSISCWNHSEYMVPWSVYQRTLKQSSKLWAWTGILSNIWLYLIQYWLDFTQNWTNLINVLLKNVVKYRPIWQNCPYWLDSFQNCIERFKQCMRSFINSLLRYYRCASKGDHKKCIAFQGGNRTRHQ